MNYSDFIGRYNILLPRKRRKSLPKPVSTYTEQRVVFSKRQSSKTLRDIAPNQIQRSPLSSRKRRSSSFMGKPQATTDADTRNTAMMIIHNTLGVGVTSVTIPIPTLNKENRPQEYQSSDTSSAGPGYHLGRHRVLLKEDQVASRCWYVLIWWNLKTIVLGKASGKLCRETTGSLCLVHSATMEIHETQRTQT